MPPPLLVTRLASPFFPADQHAVLDNAKGACFFADADIRRSQMENSSTIKVGVIGYGYWGPNIVRNLVSRSDVSVAVVADQNNDRLSALKKIHPSIERVSDATEVITATDVDAIVIATPVRTHWPLVRAALEAG